MINPFRLHRERLNRLEQRTQGKAEAIRLGLRNAARGNPEGIEVKNNIGYGCHSFSSVGPQGQDALIIRSSPKGAPLTRRLLGNRYRFKNLGEIAPGVPVYWNPKGAALIVVVEPSTIVTEEQMRAFASRALMPSQNPTFTPGR